MTVFLAMALGRTDAAPSPRFLRPHMRAGVNRGCFRCRSAVPSRNKHGNPGRSRAPGGCFGHAAERQSCLQRDVMNYSRALLKGPQRTEAAAAAAERPAPLC